MSAHVPPPLLILKTGDSLTAVRDRLGDFEDWLRAGLAAAGARITVFDPRAGLDWPAPATVAGVVVTGSSAMVTDREPWSERSADWLRRAVAAGLPVLGICYGHQLLADALGGVVADHPGGPEVGTVPIELTDAAGDDPLFRTLPHRFDAQASHRQSVRRLPDGAVRLAGNDFEPHHAFRIGERAWGIQFHPEFGPEATRSYVDRQAPLLTALGRDPAAIRGAVGPTPIAAGLLPRFASLAHQLPRRRLPLESGG